MPPDLWVNSLSNPIPWFGKVKKNLAVLNKLFYFLFFITFSLLNCQPLSLNSETPPPQQLTSQPSQETELQLLPLSLDIQIDEQGNGFILNSNLEKTEILTLHKYQIFSPPQNQILQGVQPEILWEKSGKGEILYQEASYRPGIGLYLPSEADQRSLKRLSKEFHENIFDQKIKSLDFQRTGLNFLSRNPTVNSDGMGLLSGVLSGRKLRENNLFKYPLAYIPIESFQFQNSLIELSEFVVSEEHPWVWFNQTKGIAIFKSIDAVWVLQEIHKQKINAIQKILGTSLIYPLVQLDNKGKGWILTKKTQSEFKLHLIQDFKWIETKNLDIKINQGHSFTFSFSDGQGFLLSYTPAQTSSELNIFSIKDHQVQPVRSVTIPLKQALIYTLDHAIQTQGPQKGRGVLIVGTTQQTTNTGKIFLFPIINGLPQL